MDTVILKFKKASANGGLAEISTPYLEGDYKFTIDELVTYDREHLIPIKNISFPWCVEMQQDLSRLSQRDEFYEMLAEKLKQDFLKMIRAVPPIITDAPIPFEYLYNPPMKDGHIDAIFAMVETGEIEDGNPVVVSKVIYAPQMGVEYEWVNEEHKIIRPIKSEQRALKMYDDICVIERTTPMTDEAFAALLKQAHDVTPVNVEINHMGINAIINRRVRAYCERMGLTVSDYHGVLPYRTFKVTVPDVEINKEDPSKSKLSGTTHEADLGIPEVLVHTLQNALHTLPSGLLASPMMIDPVDMGVCFSVIERLENGHLQSKYRVKISAPEPIKFPDLPDGEFPKHN
jgi:hypothetical protein